MTVRRRIPPKRLNINVEGKLELYSDTENLLYSKLSDNEVYLNNNKILILYNKDYGYYLSQVSIDMISDLYRSNSDFNSFVKLIQTLYKFVEKMNIDSKYANRFNFDLYKTDIKTGLFSSKKTQLVQLPGTDVGNVGQLSNLLTIVNEFEAYHFDESNFIVLGDSKTIATKDLRCIVHGEVKIPDEVKRQILSLSILLICGKIEKEDFSLYMTKIYDKYGLFETEFQMFGGIIFKKEDGFSMNREVKFHGSVQQNTGSI